MFEDEEPVAWVREKSTVTLVTALELLSDGQWHSLHEIVAAVTHTVPPGVGFRWAERKRVNALRAKMRKLLTPNEYAEWVSNPDHLARERNLDMDHIIRAGQRGKAREVLYQSPRIESRREGTEILIRRVPMSDYALPKPGRQKRSGATHPEE